MKSKHLIFSLLLMMTASFGYSQTYKFVTTGFSVLEKNEKGKWGKWSDLEKSKMIVSLDTKKNRIVIYSQEVQLYRIVDYPAKQETNTTLTYPFICQDDDGEKFNIAIVTRKDQADRKQLYIYQRNVILVYNIEVLDEKKKS